MLVTTVLVFTGMIIKTISLEARHEEKIGRIKKEVGLQRSEIVRQAIDQYQPPKKQRVVVEKERN